MVPAGGEGGLAGWRGVRRARRSTRTREQRGGCLSAHRAGAGGGAACGPLLRLQHISLLCMLLVCLQAGEPECSGELVHGPGAAAGSQPTENKTPCHGIAQAFKAAALEAVREYFASSDAAEVARRLEELNEPGLQNIMVKLVRPRSVTPPAHEQSLAVAHFALQ